MNIAIAWEYMILNWMSPFSIGLYEKTYPNQRKLRFFHSSGPIWWTAIATNEYATCPWATSSRKCCNVHIWAARLVRYVGANGNIVKTALIIEKRIIDTHKLNINQCRFDLWSCSCKHPNRRNMDELMKIRIFKIKRTRWKTRNRISVFVAMFEAQMRFYRRTYKRYQMQN